MGVIRDMARGREMNRHHRERMKNKRKDDFVYHEGFPIGKHVKTPKLCSCEFCGNPRKFFGNSKEGRTIQELRNELP